MMLRCWDDAEMLRWWDDVMLWWWIWKYEMMMNMVEILKCNVFTWGWVSLNATWCHLISSLFCPNRVTPWLHHVDYSSSGCHHHHHGIYVDWLFWEMSWERERKSPEISSSLPSLLPSYPPLLIHLGWDGDGYKSISSPMMRIYFPHCLHLWVYPSCATLCSLTPHP